MNFDEIAKLAEDFKEASKKKDKKRVDLDVRPTFFAKNYDYGEPGLGSGLYRGKMDRYKSVKDFFDKSRKQRKRKKKLLDVYAKSLSHQQKQAGDVVDLFTKHRLNETKESEPKHIDSHCEFCPDSKLVYDSNEDVWTCPSCAEEYEDAPHQEGAGVFKMEELDPFTRKRMESDEEES